MAFATPAIKNYLLNTGSYAAACAYMALCSTTPSGSSFGTELSGGTPPYGRIASNWQAPSGGVMSTAANPFNIPPSITVNGAGFFSASTAGTYYDGGAVTPQPFSSQGLYTITATETLT